MDIGRPSAKLEIVIAILSLGLATFAGDAIQALATTDGFVVHEITSAQKWTIKGGYVITADPATKEQLQRYEKVFVDEFSLYPPSFVRKLRATTFIFCRNLTVHGLRVAASPINELDTMFYDVELGAYNEHYQRVVLHHEFFHFLDDRMGHMRDDPDWNKLNPSGFKYSTGGREMQVSGVGELTSGIPGFVTRYATSAVEEDKAELFAHLVVDAAELKKRHAHDGVYIAKVEVLQRRLRGFDTTMGAPFWSAVSKKALRRERTGNRDH